MFSGNFECYVSVILMSETYSNKSMASLISVWFKCLNCSSISPPLSEQPNKSKLFSEIWSLNFTTGEVYSFARMCCRLCIVPRNFGGKWRGKLEGKKK